MSARVRTGVSHTPATVPGQVPLPDPAITKHASKTSRRAVTARPIPLGTGMVGRAVVAGTEQGSGDAQSRSSPYLGSKYYGRGEHMNVLSHTLGFLFHREFGSIFLPEP